MHKTNSNRELTPELIRSFASYLREQEKSASTIEKYTRDIRALRVFLHGRAVTKSALIEWKESLTNQYAAASVNTMLAAANTFCDFAGWVDLKVKPLRIQRNLFCREEKELTREEYLRLVRAAQSAGNERLSLVLQAICSTGIRVSELKFITIEALHAGRAVVNCKGKTRTIFLPEKLRRALMQYTKKKKQIAGPVFISKTGKPQYLAGYEGTLPKRRRGARQSIPTQPAPSFRPNLLCAGKGFGPAGRYSWPFQCQYHSNLYHGKRRRPCPED